MKWWCSFTWSKLTSLNVKVSLPILNIDKTEFLLVIILQSNMSFSSLFGLVKASGVLRNARQRTNHRATAPRGPSVQ